jgi:hypothetical protein
MRSAALRLALAFAVAGGCFASIAHAERATLGPHLGYNLDFDAPLLGVESRIDLTNVGSSVILQLNPSFSYYFVDNVDLFNFSLNLPFEFVIGGSKLRPFVAPGFGLYHFSNGGSHSEGALMLLAGLLFRLGVVDPFIQLRVGIADASWADLMGGVLFEL